jgi:hypothetical protein
MEPLLTAQTRQNIVGMLEYLGIHHALMFSEDPLDNEDRSRVKAVDPNGLILLAIRSNIGPDDKQWSHDSGDMHNVHGIRVRASYRSRTTPSLQVCVIEAKGGDYDYCLEIDVDFHNPFEDFLGHAAEVLQNKLQRKTTDPARIAAMMRERGIAS